MAPDFRLTGRALLKMCWPPSLWPLSHHNMAAMYGTSKMGLPIIDVMWSPQIDAQSAEGGTPRNALLHLCPRQNV